MTPTPTPMVKPTRLELTNALAAVPDTPSARDDDEPRDWGTIAFRVFVALLLLIGAGAAIQGAQGSSAEDERARLLQLIDTECGPGGTYVGQPLCVATAPQRAEETAAVAVSEGVDAAQVIELVRAELDARGPGTVPADVADAAVRRVLAENPGLYQGAQGLVGERGPGPSQEQIDAAVAAVMAADPDRFRGRDGASPPCLSEPAQCQGADGEPPVSITQRYGDGSSSVCTRDDGSPDSAPTYTCPPPSGGSGSGDEDPPADPGPTDPAPPDPTPSDPPDDAGGGGLFGG